MDTKTTDRSERPAGTEAFALAPSSAPVVLTDAQWNAIVSGIRQDGQIIAELRREVELLERYKRRMEWLHDCSAGSVDARGCEWGIYRVKWENGQAVEVWQTNSDFSDLDAEMAREAALPNNRRSATP